MPERERVQKAPADMLKLIHAIEENRDDVGGLLRHQMPRDSEPLALSADMQVDQALVVFFAVAALKRAFFESHIHREFAEG